MEVIKIDTLSNGRIKLPPGFSLKSDGIYWEDDWICSSLEVLAYTRDGNSENWGRLIRFKDLDNQVHTHAIPMELLSGDCSELYSLLLSSGLRITTHRSKKGKLSEFLQNSKTDNRALSTFHIGWHDNHFVLPDGVIPDTDALYLQSDNSNFNGYRVSGTLEEWQKHVSIPCQGNSRLIFALSCAFASPLLPLIHAESGGFNLMGASSVGKSTALSIAASVWGSPKYIQQWKTTGNALEAVAEAHNHALLCLDELGQVDGKEAGEIAYMLANGSGKNRLKAKGGLRRKFEWQLLFLSTGEVSILDKVNESGKKTYAGMLTRMVDIPADAGTGHRLFDTIHDFNDGSALAQYLKDTTSKYYGTPIRVFLQYLPGIKYSLPKRLDQIKRDFFDQHVLQEADGQVKRVAERFALVASAGELAIELNILPCNRGEALNAIEKCFKAWLDNRGGLGSYEVDEAINQVQAFIEANQSSRFALICNNSVIEQKIINQAGYKRLTQDNVYEFLIPPPIFDKEICRGLNPRSVKKILADQGYLLRDSDGRYTRSINIGKGKKRLIHLTPKIFMESDI